MDEFEVVEVIGSGQYGVCKKVRKKSDRKVIKIFRSRKNNTTNVSFVVDICLEGARLWPNDRSRKETALSRGQLVKGV